MAISKLFNLKEWLTIDETAKHLSIAFEEEVTVADIYRLALDGYLTLSVNLINHTRARIGNVVGWKDTKWLLFPNEMTLLEQDPVSKIKDLSKCPDDLVTQVKELSENERGKYYPFFKSMTIDKQRYLNLEDNVVSIDGIWDLPMLGAERLDIEHDYQMLTGGPAVTLQSLEGAFLQKDETTLCQLQERFDNSEFKKGSKASLEQLKLSIENENIDEKAAKALLDKYAEDRESYLKKREKTPNDDYYPAASLPSDAVLVVKTKAISEFIESVSGKKSNVSGEPANDKERTSMLKIILALAKNCYTYPNHGSLKQIIGDFELNDNGVSEKTLKKYLDEADRL